MLCAFLKRIFVGCLSACLALVMPVLVQAEPTAELEALPYFLLCNFNRYRPFDQLTWPKSYESYPTPAQREGAPCEPMHQNGFGQSAALGLDLTEGSVYITFHADGLTDFRTPKGQGAWFLAFVDTGDAAVDLFFGLKGGQNGQTVFSHRDQSFSYYLLPMKAESSDASGQQTMPPWQAAKATQKGLIRLQRFRGLILLPLQAFLSPLAEPVTLQPAITGVVLWYEAIGDVPPNASLVMDQFGLAGTGLENPVGRVGQLTSLEQFDQSKWPTTTRPTVKPAEEHLNNIPKEAPTDHTHTIHWLFLTATALLFTVIVCLIIYALGRTKA